MDMSHYNKDYDTSHPFRVVAPYEPMGDQPEAIESLAEGIESGQWAQVLLGATGTGKTFTMAKLIETDLGHRPQQDPGSPAVQRIQGLLPG